MLDYLKQKWDEDAFEGIRFLDKIVKNEEDQNSINEACKLVADRIRSSSAFKKHAIHKELLQCSLLCRVYLSFQFRSIRDVAFPRYDVFYGEDTRNPAPMIVPPNRQFVQAYGKNRYFNLGVLSDGSSIEEPRLVHVPPCQKISMSNVHSLFLTISGRVYGCGRATNVLLGEQKVTEKTSKGYIIEPTLIKIPDEEEILDIATTETCSILVSSRFVYVIGECGHFKNEKNDKKFVSSNCRRYATEGCESRDLPKIVINEKSVEVWYYISSEIELNRRQVFGGDNCDCLKSQELSRDLNFYMLSRLVCRTRNWTEVVLKHDGNNIKLFLSQKDSHLNYSLEQSDRISPCDFVLNGKVVCNSDMKQFKASHDGKVVIQTQFGIMARGRAVIWREKNAGWKTVKNSNVESRMANCKVVIILEEIPGSYGVDTFCASPDCDNVIVQFGPLSDKKMSSLVTYADDRIWRSVRKGIMKHVTHGVRTEPSLNSLIMIRAEQLRLAVIKSLEKYPTSNEDMDFTKYADFLDVLNVFYDDPDEFYQMWKMRHNGGRPFPKNSQSFTYSEVLTNEKGINVHGVDGSTRRTLLASLRDLVGNCPFMEDYEEVANLVYSLLDILMEFVKDIGSDEGNGSGNRRVVDKMFYPEIECSVLSENVHEIQKNRIESGDLDESEVPMDLEINYNIRTRGEEHFRFFRNRVIFELMYPFLVDQIVDGVLELSHEAFNFIFSRFDTFYVEKNQRNDKGISEEEESYDLKGTRKEVVRRFDNEVWSRTVSENRKIEFFKPGTPNSDIWNLETTDGKIVPAHKYLLLLHSRQISAMQRFNDACFVPNFNSFDVQDDQEKEIAKVKVEGTEKVVKEAMIALLDITTVYDKKMPEIIDIFIFFDYHLMNEAASDVLNIIFQIANDTNIGYLYELFEHYEDKMLPKFLENEYLIFMSNSPCLPPLHLIKKIIETGLMDALEEDWYEKWPGPIRELNVETEDIIELFVDLKKDHEEKFWEMLQEELNIDEKELRIYEEKAKLLNQTRKRKSSYNTGSAKSISTPVSISGKKAKEECVSGSNDSFSTPNSANAPITNVRREVSTPVTIEKKATSSASAQSPLSTFENTPPQSFDEDFPLSPYSLSTPLSKKKSPKFVIAKGTKLKKADDMLKSPSPTNPWNRNRTSSCNFETVPEEVCMPSSSSGVQRNFNEVVEEEKKLEKKRRGQKKVSVSLVHLEMEEQAEEEIGQVFRRDNQDEALVTVELVENENEEEKEQPVWGMMPGILKR